MFIYYQPLPVTLNLHEQRPDSSAPRSFAPCMERRSKWVTVGLRTALLIAGIGRTAMEGMLSSSCKIGL
jgi:hypothetical protein